MFFGMLLQMPKRKLKMIQEVHFEQYIHEFGGLSDSKRLNSGLKYYAAEFEPLGSYNGDAYFIFSLNSCQGNSRNTAFTHSNLLVMCTCLLLTDQQSLLLDDVALPFSPS